MSKNYGITDDKVEKNKEVALVKTFKGG